VFQAGYEGGRAATASVRRRVLPEASLPDVARWTGTWLTGPVGDDAAADDEYVTGTRLGLPPEGPGSAASVLQRLFAFLLDLAVGVLIGGFVVLFLNDVTPVQRSLANNVAFAAQMVVLQALTGQSMGMRLVGIRVRRLTREGPLGLLTALLRTALLALLVPALVYDRDKRGLHDRAAGTVVVRAR
jgi:uncharacterized RDD family membrane protein YckC